MELTIRAESLTQNLRRKIIMEFKELEIHGFLKELFQAMEPSYTVEITHGVSEYGKDLVIVKSDQFGKEVIGVVVKCGHIRGTTHGDVDLLKDDVDELLSKSAKNRMEEIKSQIDQALKHPAKLKSSLSKLPVSKVFVVLAGSISNNARTRLKKEISSEVELFDLDWLVEKFSEFYPQVFFHGRVIDFLERKRGGLEEKHRRGKSGRNLSEYFVDPLIKPLGENLQFDEKSLQTFFEIKRVPFFELLKISKQQSKLILAGDPGTGKSGAMAKLVIDRYQDICEQLVKKPGKPEEKISIPILVHAREFLKSESIDNLLDIYFEDEETKARFNIDLLLVDGLDEIKSMNRPNVINKLDEFSEKLQCSYILTTRKIDLITTLSEKYAKFELLPFEFNQAIKLVSKLISDNKVLDVMKESLEKIQDQIFLVPLSLLLLVDLVEEKKEVPASMTELFDRFFDMALGREDTQKGIQNLFDYIVKKRFLGMLAHQEFWNKNRLEIPLDDYEKFINNYAKQFGWQLGDMENFVEEIERSGILELRSEINFKHRSFLDYFAGFYVFENREEIENLNDLIVDVYFDDIWNEVAFFYIGLRREINKELLTQIFSYPSDDIPVNINKLLIGRLLQAGWHSPAQHLVEGIKQGIEYSIQVRDNFQQITTPLQTPIPGIIFDFIVFALSDLSFNSGFLERHVKENLEKLINSPSNRDVYMAVILFLSTRRFFRPEESEYYIENILENLASLPDDKEQGRLLLLMEVLEEDKDRKKLLHRRVRKLIRKSPEIFKALLPAKKKGFR